MFVPVREAVEEFNPDRAGEFVRYWSRFYTYDVKVLGKHESIDYFHELNIRDGSLYDLTKENILRLLRWKDPHMLTQEILTGPNKGKENDAVNHVLQRLNDINDFRRGAVAEDKIRAVADSVFGSGIVFRAFLLHMAKPHVCPIADQHVFRTFTLHTKKPTDWKPDNWEAYDEYRAYFHGISDAMGVHRTTHNVVALKQIDNALMVYGKF